MKNFIVYTLSGEILRTGSCKDSDYEHQAGLDEFILEGTANDATQRIVDGLVVDKPPVVVEVPVFDLTQAQAKKISELDATYKRRNLSSFVYDGKDYTADQTAQNNLTAIANYAALNNALPPMFPNMWQAIDGSVINVPDVASFKPLYAALVAQGSSNFIHLAMLEAQVMSLDPLTATQADLDAIVW